MNNHWSSDISNLLEAFFGVSKTTEAFTVISFIALGGLIISAWVVVNVVSSGKKGIIASFFSQTIPICAAVFIWILFSRNVDQIVAHKGIASIAPLAGAILVGLLTSWIIARKLLNVSPSASILSNVLTYACVTGIVVLGSALVRDMDSGIDNLAEKKNQREKDTQHIMGQDTGGAFIMRD